MQNWVVVAHPDDETIFFGGLVMAKRSRPWRIVCVTDGNADGRGSQRKREFARACRELRAKGEWLGFPDRYGKKLDPGAIARALRGLGAPSEVYTHGPLGEYGHPHHQAICAGVISAFDGRARIWHPAYNVFPEKVVRLTRTQFERKARILSRIYRREAQRWIPYLPCTAIEGFARFDARYARALSTGGRRPAQGPLGWVLPLWTPAGKTPRRPF